MNIPGKPILLDDFNPALLSIAIPRPRPDAKPNKFGTPYFVKYNNGPARFACGALRSPFGVQVSELDENQTLQIQFELSSSEDGGPSPYDQFIKIQERIIQLVVENKTVLYKDGARVDDSVVRERVNGFVRLSDKGYPPSIRPIIETNYDNPEQILSVVGKPLLIDENRETIPVTRSSIVSIVGRNSHLKPVVEIKHLFVSNKGFTTTVKWRMSHAKLIQSGASEGTDWEMDDLGPSSRVPAVSRETLADDSEAAESADDADSSVAMDEGY